MKILAIVCPVIRHQYTFNIISEKVPIAGVIKQHRVRKKVSRKMSEEEEKSNNIHFQLRDEAEKKWLGGIGKEINTQSKTLDVHSNSLDLPEVDNFVDVVDPDILITIGCGLVKKDILDRVKFGFNFHLGMSPRYRGSAGFFWPIYNMDPERLATSILVLEDNIDGGPIVHHSRPDIEIGDKIHDLAAKSIVSGAHDFAKILKKLCDGEELITKPQKSAGRVHYESAYHPRHLAVSNYLMSNGLIEDYLKNKKERDKYVALVQYPHL